MNRKQINSEIKSLAGQPNSSVDVIERQINEKHPGVWDKRFEGVARWAILGGMSKHGITARIGNRII